MRRIYRVLLLFLVLTAIGPPGTLVGQELPTETFRAFSMSVDVHGAAAVQQASMLVDTLAADGDLRLVSSRADRYLLERHHDTFRQYYQGVPVSGGGITRQRDTVGPVSVFGTVHDDIDVDVVPQISAGDAIAILETLTEAEPAANSIPQLTVLPALTGRYALAWRVTMEDYHEYALNAHTGAVEYREPLFHSQSVVGAGDGIAGVRKKVSARRANGRFETFDELRPAEIVTLDARFNNRRLDQLIDGSPWSTGDLARDDDNEWVNPAVVDAHVYTGFTYDYLLARHGWRGVDGHDGRILSIVNEDAANARAFPPPFGPEGRGLLIYGLRTSGTPMTSADIVAHELMHNVTHFSVLGRTGERLRGITSVLGPTEFTLDGQRYRCGQSLYYTSGAYAGRQFRFLCFEEWFRLFTDEGSAINEAFSDILGTAVEFAIHDPAIGPLRADYLTGEDTGVTSRSLENPRSHTLGRGSLRYPDANQSRVGFLVGRFLDGGGHFWSNFGSVDGGRTMTFLPTVGYRGQHWNSTILSHAFYLAIEGGRNRTTGRQVRGLGPGNRAQVERAFFRAMTDLMPALAGFHQAAAVIRQSARDLDGAGSALYQAIDAALSAVGLPKGTR